jgi:hypothetical protein
LRAEGLSLFSLSLSEISGGHGAAHSDGQRWWAVWSRVNKATLAVLPAMPNATTLRHYVVTTGSGKTSRSGLDVLHAAAPTPSTAHLTHLMRDALHGASADATLPSNLQHALAGPQMALDSFF